MTFANKLKKRIESTWSEQEFVACYNFDFYNGFYYKIVLDSFHKVFLPTE